MEKLRIKKDEILYSENDLGSAAYLIETGQIEFFSDRDGYEVIIARLGPGEMFGEMALLDDGKRWVSARAIKDTDLTVIEREHVIDRLEKMEPIVSLVFRVLVSRLRLMKQQLSLHSLADAEMTLTRSTTNLSLDNQYKAMVGFLKQEQELHQAIKKNQLVPYFMPIQNVATGEMAGFEALVRWQHPEKGLLGPAAFIDLAEQSDLIRDIDMSILHGSWDLLQKFEKAREEDALKNVESLSPANLGLNLAKLEFFSINLSGRHFSDGLIIENLRDFLEKSDCPPDKLKVEVNEQILIDDPEAALIILKKIKELGILVSLDDFGTGYSSLSYLYRFPIDSLKLDQSFVKDYHVSQRARDIVKGVVSMAQALNLTTIAEGVETADDLVWIKELGFDYAQGYHLGKPQPASVLLLGIDPPIDALTTDALLKKKSSGHSAA